MRIYKITILAFIIGIGVGIILEYKKPQQYLKARTLLSSTIKNLLSKQETYNSTCSYELLENLGPLLKNETSLYAVIGHAYGEPNAVENATEISPNLKKFLLANKNAFEKIIFTGDILQKPSLAKWKKFNNFIGGHTNQVIIAPGNHDVGYADNATRDVFNQTFNASYPQMFVFDGDHYLITDTTSPAWEISEKAIKKLGEIKGKVNNLFIFTHHIMQKNPEKIANSTSGMPKKLPSMFEKIKNAKTKFKEINVISGDTGAIATMPRFNCTQRENIKFISQGIGGFPNDEILVINGGEIKRLKI